MEREILVSFYNTVEKLKRDTKNLSFSMTKQYFYDFLCLDNLGDALNVSVNLLETLPCHDSFISPLINNASLLKEVMHKALQCFKECEFYYYERIPHVKMSKKEENDLLHEFLMYFSPTLWELYCELLDKGHVFSSSKTDVEAESFMMPHIDEYYFLINENIENSLIRIESIIHELSHIESSRILLNYRYNCFDGLLRQLLQETISMYSEYSFFDYCMENYIFKEAYLFIRNMEDYLFLKRVKAHYYFSASLQCAEIVIDETGRYLIENGPFFPETNDLFDLGKNTREGQIQDFFYSIGNLTAFELLEKERLGYPIEKSIREFLIHADELDYLAKKVQFNADFMTQNIKEHLTPLQKKYPIYGYTVE